MPLLSKPELLKLAVQVSAEFNLDPALICAHVDARSRWDSGLCIPIATYQGLNLTLQPLESEHRQTLWGLMAISGAFARVHQFSGSLPDLLNPQTNLREGCRILQALSLRECDETERWVQSLLKWNSQPQRELVAETLTKLEAYRELIARIPEMGKTFPGDDSFPLPLSSQIQGNPLL